MARARLTTAEGWRTFIEVEGATPGTFYRLVDDNRHREADGKKWQACAIDFTPPEQSIEGTLGEVKVTIPNVSRVPLALVEQGDILGCKLTAFIAYTGNLGSFANGNAIVYVHTVMAVDATERSFTMTCRHGMPGARRLVPRGRFDRTLYPQLAGLEGTRGVGR